MDKRILVTSTDLMMIQFLVPHIVNLSQKGYKIEIACSNVGGRIDEVRDKLESFTNAIYEVALRRSPIAPSNVKGYQDMRKIFCTKHYDIVWTNEPVMGVVTRLCAKKYRKHGTMVLYMAHGFHFYKGAPKLNWLLYYPIEKLMASKTDMIVTVNQEDYHRAKRNMRAKQVKYIHGIGINTERLTTTGSNLDIRRELDLQDDAFIVLSVGELNPNKNQKTIIQALGLLKDEHIHYILCGKGDSYDELNLLVKKLNLEKQVHFLGYRNDVVDICSQADVYVMPSKREGLPVASLEAMYCGLPLLTSNIRGLVDVMEDEVSGYMYPPEDIHGFAKGIECLKNSSKLRKVMGNNNQKTVQPYCIEATKQEVFELMGEL